MYKPIVYSVEHVNHRLVPYTTGSDLKYAYVKYEFDTVVSMYDMENEPLMKHFNGCLFVDLQNELHKESNRGEIKKVISLKRIDVDDLFSRNQLVDKYFLTPPELNNFNGYDIEALNKHLTLIKEMLYDCKDEFFD